MVIVRNRLVEFVVGLFILVAVLALMALAFKVSGLTTYSSSDYYPLTAAFDNIGNLKVRAPVRISGVAVGRVTSISLDEKTFRATVHMEISKKLLGLPIDTSASILTQGLLGSNYISLMPGFEEQTLKPGGMIETTHSALILENLVGQLMFNLKGGNNNNNDAATSPDANTDTNKTNKE